MPSGIYQHKKGYKLSDEHIRKRTESRLKNGFWKDIEKTKEKLRKARIGRKPMLGKKHSTKTKRKISETLKRGERKRGGYKKCIICDREFYLMPSDFNNKNYQCCGKKCRGEWWSKKLTKNLSFENGMKLYKSGRRYEYKTLLKLYAEKYTFCIRSPNSRGIFDVWGIKFKGNEIELILIQVKGIKNAKTLKSALPRKERIIMLNAIENDNFKWGNGKIRGIPKWANMVNFEVWVWEKGRKCYRYRLNLENKEWFLRDSFKFMEEIKKRHINSSNKEPVILKCEL